MSITDAVLNHCHLLIRMKKKKKRYFFILYLNKIN